jgi:uncharacterized protein YqjF (DUF2071 family)
MTGLEPLLTKRPHVMNMTWLNLAFLHWRVPAAVLEPFIPKGLHLETFDGRAWLGVVPFRMANVRAALLPAVPGTHNFLELNVRTYVTDGSRPGVWFFSLDCQNALAVRGARAAFHLPYMDAVMREVKTGASIRYESRRTHRGEPSAEFDAHYAPNGNVFTSSPGSLEHWLTERYCLYSADRAGRIYRGEIHHAPWPLQPATCDIATNTMASPLGLTLPPTPDLAHYAARLEVRAWLIARVGHHQTVAHG